MASQEDNQNDKLMHFKRHMTYTNGLENRINELHAAHHNLTNRTNSFSVKEELSNDQEMKNFTIANNLLNSNAVLTATSGENEQINQHGLHRSHEVENLAAEQQLSNQPEHLKRSFEVENLNDLNDQNPV